MTPLQSFILFFSIQSDKNNTKPIFRAWLNISPDYCCMKYKNFHNPHILLQKTHVFIFCSTPIKTRMKLAIETTQKRVFIVCMYEWRRKVRPSDFPSKFYTILFHYVCVLLTLVLWLHNTLHTFHKLRAFLTVTAWWPKF